jgi:hypothetical protein
MDAYMHQH